MLQRFVSASAVASVLIALAAVGLRLSPIADQESRYLLTTIWCMVPLVWGAWAVLTPGGWVEQHLPVWGALLGLMAGLMALFVLDVPAQLTGEVFPAWLRGIGVLLAVCIYYVLWIPVRRVHGALTGPSSAT